MPVPAGPAGDIRRGDIPGGAGIVMSATGGRPSLHGRFEAGRLQHHVLGAGAITACVQQETFQPMPAAR
jgi:hypothetical protein